MKPQGLLQPHFPKEQEKSEGSNPASQISVVCGAGSETGRNASGGACCQHSSDTGRDVSWRRRISPALSRQILKPLLFPLSSIPGGTVEQLHSAAKLDNPNASHKLPVEPHRGLQGQAVFCCSPNLSGTCLAAHEPVGFITIKLHCFSCCPINAQQLGQPGTASGCSLSC